MKLLLGTFIGFVAIAISLAESHYPEGPIEKGDVSTPASTSDIPDFCKSNLRKNKKVDKCCKEVEKIQSSGGSLCPTPKPCTIEKCGRVCNRYIYYCDKGKKKKHEKPPKQNNYPSGPDDLPEATKPPKGRKSVSKPPKHGYPSVPEDVSEATKPPKGRKASAKPPKQGYPSVPEDLPLTTEQPGYPEGPAETQKPSVNHKYPSGPELTSTTEQIGYPQGPQ
uniref:Uncharacterized protein n=1 Tax=Meloidogyne incognita TaxID=6306 RepID=A0A914L8J8_MELIC